MKRGLLQLVFPWCGLSVMHLRLAEMAEWNEVVLGVKIPGTQSTLCLMGVRSVSGEVDWGGKF